ncbi:hypothetical protein Vretimale_19130 [Volvox reticuliferus]|uniref:Poly(A) RNA polymerase mitochondrial-like central palm domain-containing protein n=1 Tax=Volvox reticuliferus TaxID=1737510 RepID=A0A8J4GZF9_9CHLO|nr:hypothetical protein Vretimale_19130 [Volvox reticuliferus]
MVDQISPTTEDIMEKEQVLQYVRQAAQDAFPEYRGTLRVEPFGSYMCGLGTKSSDIDVVLVGMVEPSSFLGFYSKMSGPGWRAKECDEMRLPAPQRETARHHYYYHY